jgi:hypothetical protein
MAVLALKSCAANNNQAAVPCSDPDDSDHATPLRPDIAVFLPRNTCLQELRECLSGLECYVQPSSLERNILNDQLKSLTLYLQSTDTFDKL